MPASTDHTAAYIGAPTADRRRRLQLTLTKVAKSLAALPDDFKTSTGSEQIRAQIEAAAATFIS